MNNPKHITNRMRTYGHFYTAAYLIVVLIVYNFHVSPVWFNTFLVSLIAFRLFDFMWYLFKSDNEL